MIDKQTQSDKFKEAARQLETDDNEERFNERLKRLAKAGKGGTMRLSELSNRAIIDLHNATAEAYASDRDHLSELCGQYGVDETSDWPRHVRDLETELARRNLEFEAIPV